MGSCISVNQNCQTKDSDSVLIESPIKENGLHSQQLKPQLSSLAVTNATTSRHPSSREEVFFDSHLLLESDCEDFLSVNGDFTPSCGNTPIRQSSFKQAHAHQLDKCLSMDRAFGSLPEPSPKSLFELFYESFSGEQVDGDQNFQGTKSVVANRTLEVKLSILDQSSKSTNGAPRMSLANSAYSSEITPNRASKPKKDKLSRRSASCCLPSVGRSLSFGDRKRRLTPA